MAKTEQERPLFASKEEAEAFWASLPWELRCPREANELERKKKYWTWRSYTLLNAAKNRAAKKGLPFSLTLEWVFDRLWAHRCEITGLRFRGSDTVGVRSNFSPSIDVNVPALGYTPENSRMVVWGYNAAKGVGTDEDVLEIAEALVRQKALKDGPASP